jgi:hypothetical protein
MRWTDLPRDRETADADAPVLRRGEWDDLRQRLERLPAGHPSSPDDEARADEARPDEARADERAEPDGRQPDRPERAGPGRRSGPGGHDIGSAVADGRREPYQPWFSSGESPEPWFSADPEA